MKKTRQWFAPGRLTSKCFAWLAHAHPAKIFIGLLAFSVIVVYGYYHRAVNRPLDFGEQTVSIERGDTLMHVATRLRERGIIDETASLRLLGRQDDLGKRVQAGEYRFPQGTSLKEFLHHIASGKGQADIKVTILEGWTFRQMREQLRRAPKLAQATALMTDQQIMAELGHPELAPEGRFFPDTYFYTAGETDLAIYRKAFRLMQEKLDLAWQNRTADGLLKNKDEALIMASIIQKETYIDEERAQIAGVFHNRLRKKMRLQTDPTVIYGLGAAYDGNITRAHLKTDTPYNTYTRSGLTPTPISLPGDASLKAAARPATTSAYYFVAKGGGRHQFSETLRQHNQAVNRYIRKQKSG